MATQPMQHKDLFGALFVNTHKTKPEHPDRTGTCTIAGQPYRISGWIKQDARNNHYVSLSFTKPIGREEF